MQIAFNPQGKEREAKEFAADHVYLPQQGDAVYNDEVRQLVSSLYQGFNATVFAYGECSLGETHRSCSKHVAATVPTLCEQSPSHRVVHCIRSHPATEWCTVVVVVVVNI